MLPRFYAPELDADRADGEVRLPEDEARHLTRVLRLSAGHEVAVFDGRGVEFRARVTRAAREDVVLELLERRQPAAEPSVRLTLAQAVLKPEAMDGVVRDATMMGVARIVPLITAHIAVREQALATGRPIERWRRVAIASAKQCRRAVVPTIAEPQPFDSWIAALDSDELKLMLVEPSAAAPTRDLRALLGTRPAAAALIVGPEGGWSPEERASAANAGCRLLTLGGLTWRADAVPVAALAVVRFVFGDF